MTTPEQSSSAGHGDDAGAASGAPQDSPEFSIDDLDFPPLAGRPRIIRAELARSQGWKSAVEIVLERGDRRAEVVKDAIGEEVVLFRCAAEATLEAIHELLGGPVRFALVGAKRVLAFDSAVILACVRTLGANPRKLIGCVPITEDPVLAVARAVLHATNRILEVLPNAYGEGEDAVAGVGETAEDAPEDVDAPEEEDPPEDTDAPEKEDPPEDTPEDEGLEPGPADAEDPDSAEMS